MSNATNTETFYLPTKPFNHTDALNRAAAATGSPRYAALASSADYNGHSAALVWNTFHKSWQAYYTWSGIHYIVNARSKVSAASAARAVREFYDRQGKGARVGVSLKNAPEEAAQAMREALLAEGFVEGAEPTLAWRTWVHDAAFRLIRAEREQGLVIDASKLLDYASEDEWFAAAYAARRALRA